MAQDEHSNLRPSLHPVERRKAPRRAAVTDDWESIALGRVARRVGSLPQPPADSGPGPASPEEARSFGWEEAALRNLRQRLKDRGPA